VKICRSEQLPAYDPMLYIRQDTASMRLFRSNLQCSNSGFAPPVLELLP